MKPTEKQNRAIDIATQQISSWLNSNDIDSQTNPYEVIDACDVLCALEDFTPEESDGLAEKINDLYYYILNLKN